MRRLKRALVLAVPLAGIMALMLPSSTYAATTVGGEVTVTGNGTISPGLTPTLTGQSVTFTGQVTGTITVNTTNFVFAGVGCTFSGSGSDSSVNGNGTVTGACGGTVVVTPPGVVTTGTAGCTLDYNREGTTVLISGNCTASANGTTGTFCVVGVFQFVPTSAPTVTSYQLAGSVTVAPHSLPCPSVPKPPKVV